MTESPPRQGASPPGPRALGLALACLSLTLCLSSPARSQEASGTGAEESSRATPGDSSWDKPEPKFRAHAEVGIGWQLLPGAEICGQKSCSHTDTSPLGVLRLGVEPLRGWDFGLRLGVGLFPTTGLEQTAEVDAVRLRSRTYTGFELTAARRQALSPHWALEYGGGLGLALISDSDDPRKSATDSNILGAPGDTLRTEGLSVLLQGGLIWPRRSGLQLGLHLEGGLWMLPSTRATGSLGSPASLAGAVPWLALTVGIRLESVGY